MDKSQRFILQFFFYNDEVDKCEQEESKSHCVFGELEVQITNEYFVLQWLCKTFFCSERNQYQNVKPTMFHCTPFMFVRYVYWWFVRVTLVVDLWFLPQNFGPVVGTYESLLLLCECRWGWDRTCRWWVSWGQIRQGVFSCLSVVYYQTVKCQVSWVVSLT